MNGYKIAKVNARQIYDSRSNPTVEVDVWLEDGSFGRGMVPSGASTGKFEALELRDNDKAFHGKGVNKAIGHIREILAPKLIGMDARDQAGIDRMLIELDGTQDKSRLGANALLGCSLAVCYAGAAHVQLPLYRYLGGAMANTLPLPMVQIIGGGAHAANSIDIQDFLVIPVGAESFAQGYAWVVSVYQAAKKVFSRYGKPLAIADEGGFWPSGFLSNEEGLKLLTESICEAGFEPGKEMGIALDIASSEFYDAQKERYCLHLEHQEFTREEFVDLLCDWVKHYAILSIEDGCSELDWEGNRLLTERLGNKIQLIGDDLFTTNIQRIRKGVEQKICNSVLIKMNQIGTITETMEAVSFTKNHGYLPVISARSGETEDATIVHLALASNAGQLKVGSAARSERTSKWNEVLRLEEALGKSGRFLGRSVFTDAGLLK